MKFLDHTGLDRAAEFMRLNGRLIDRHRFALHFRGGPAAPVLAALRAYENPDGGYGHALEPDLRGEGSQPVPAQHALEFLHEAGADGDPAVTRIGDYLTSITAADGGVPFVLPTVRDALIGAQGDDGGWDVEFPIWTPITRLEWRGATTVERLRTLRAHGRLKP